MDETYQEALVREFFEETGYKIRVVGEKPLWIDSAYFYNKRWQKFFRSVLIFYRVELVSSEQDTSLVNTLEPDEISAIEWIPLNTLTPSDCHRMIRNCLSHL